MGPVPEGGKFLTIEELAVQEVNDRRPILIVYAPEKKYVKQRSTLHVQSYTRAFTFIFLRISLYA